MRRLRRRLEDESGQALLEFLIVVPALMLIMFGIIEMGAAWRTYQVVTNTAREGARVAVLPGAGEMEVLDAIRERLERGGLNQELAEIEFVCAQVGSGNCFGTARTGTVTEVRVGYPYTFLFLGPVARYVSGGGDSFGTVTMRTGFVMRNE